MEARDAVTGFACQVELQNFRLAGRDARKFEPQELIDQLVCIERNDFHSEFVDRSLQAIGGDYRQPATTVGGRLNVIEFQTDFCRWFLRRNCAGQNRGKTKYKGSKR